MLPRPKLPQINMQEEVVVEEEYSGEIDTQEAQDLGKEKLANSFAKLLGFAAAIGLPPEVMPQKVEYYSQLAVDTGVADALIETIEYYFPDVEMSPAIVLALTGMAFASAVLADRAETKKKFARKDRQSGKTKSNESEKAKKIEKSVKVE